MTPIWLGITSAAITLHWLAIAWLWSWLRAIRRMAAATRRTVNQHQGSIIQLTATLADLAPVDKRAPMPTHMDADEFADLFPPTTTADEFEIVRGARPPTEHDALAALHRAGRPLTRDQLADTLGWDTWRAATELRRLLHTNQVTMATTGHGTEPTWKPT